MSDARCCFCSQLPLRRLGHSSRVERCPLCKNEVGVAGTGESFRIAAAGPGSSRRWLVGAAGALGVVLVAVGIHFASPERPTPAAMPVATVVAATPKPVVVAEPRRPILGIAKGHGWADPLVRVKPNPEVMQSAAKPNDTPRWTAHYASVKSSSRAPRTVAKRNDEALSEIALPTWLYPAPPSVEAAARRSVEAAALRSVREVGLERVATKTELAQAFSQAQKRHEGGSDRFLDGMSQERAELAGLPFLKGDACKLTDPQAEALGRTSSTLRQLLDDGRSSRGIRSGTMSSGRYPAVLSFFFMFEPTSTPQKATKRLRYDQGMPGLMQITTGMPPEFRVEFVRQLLTVPPDDDVAIAALVRLALFDPDAEVRTVAIDGLKRESADKYAPKLLEGFRYPLPSVAQHAADAVIALDCEEWLPKLVDLLDEPDPAAPFEREEGGDKLLAIREVVKINHHRNCMLCHAPAGDTEARLLRSTRLVARVPSLDEELPPMSSQAYYESFDRPSIRANETYLRQDFTVMEKVANHGKWPAVQRFDFLVRTRTLTEEQAREIEAESRSDVELPSPNHRAVLRALSRMTSTYVGSRSSDWRAELQRRRALEEGVEQ